MLELLFQHFPFTCLLEFQLENGCPECGFDGRTVDVTDVAATAWFEQMSTADVRDTNSGDRTQWRMFTAATTEVRPGDRVVWGELLL
ncbi:MAG: hypothetical protein EAZ89_06185, partial [Bacteroidetes bacterium]